MDLIPVSPIRSKGPRLTIGLGWQPKPLFFSHVLLALYASFSTVLLQDPLYRPLRLLTFGLFPKCVANPSLFYLCPYFFFVGSLRDNLLFSSRVLIQFYETVLSYL